MPRASVFLPKGSIRIISQKIHRLVNRIKEKKAPFAEHGNRVENHLVEPRHTNNRTSFDITCVVASDFFKLWNGFPAESATTGNRQSEDRFLRLLTNLYNAFLDDRIHLIERSISAIHDKNLFTFMLYKFGPIHS